VAVHGVVVLLVGVGKVGHIVEDALVQPLHERLKAGGVMVGELEAVLPAVAVRVAQQLVLEGLGVVAQEVAVQRPVPAGGAHVNVHHGAGEQSVALKLSFCPYVQTVGVEAVRERRAHCDAAGGCLGLLHQLQLRRVFQRRILQILVLLLARALLCAGLVAALVEEGVV
jgi:hypothetical protein